MNGATLQNIRREKRASVSASSDALREDWSIVGCGPEGPHNALRKNRPCRFGMDQRSPRNDKIARTTTIAPMSQMMLFITILS